MTKYALPLIALASVALSQPVRAQSDQGRPKALESVSEISPIVALLEKAAQESEMRKLLEEEFAKTLKPGPVVTNFEQDGVDLTAALSASSGSSGDTVLLDMGDPMPSILSYEKRSVTFGLDYLIHNLAGKPFVGPTATTIMLIAPGLWIVAEFAVAKRGHAYCSGKELHLALHANRPLASLSENEFGALLVVMESLRLIENIEICSVYFREKDGSFISREYRPDGASLPGLFDPEIKMNPARYADAVKELAKTNPAAKIFD